MSNRIRRSLWSRVRTAFSGQTRPTAKSQRRQAFLESLEDRSLMATLYWQGDVSNAWSNVNNWTTNPAANTAPGLAPATGDILFFDTSVANFNAVAGQGYTPNNDIAGLSNLTLNIADGGAGSDFNLSGVVAGLSVLGVSSSVTVGTGATISMPLTVANSNFDVTNTPPLTVTGAIGGTSLTKGGTGTLILSSANTFNGGSTINNGMLQITNATATGTGATTVNTGTFEINNLTHNGAVTLNNNGLLRGLGTGATQAGVVTIASGALVGLGTGLSTDVLTITSALANAAGSTVTPTIQTTGLGIHSVQGNSTAFRGIWNVPIGTLRVTSSGSFGVPTVSGPLVGSSLTLAGGNLTVLSNSALTFNGGSGTNLPVTVSANATITSQRTSAGAAVVHTFGTLSIGSFTLNMTYDNATVTSADAALDFSGAVTLTGNPIINTIRPGSARILPRFNGGIVDGGIARTLTFNNNGPSTTEEAAVITGTSSLVAASQIAITGTQPFRLVVQNAGAAGNASIRQSNTAATVLDIRSDTNNATFNNNIILDTAMELRQSRISAGAGLTFNVGSITFNNPVTLTVGTTVNTNTNYQFNTTGIVLGANGTITVNNNGTGIGTLNSTGAVSETGGVRTLTKGGSGTLQLSAAATYTGTTSINNGRVLLGSNNGLSNAPLTLGSGTTAVALDLGSFSQTVTDLSVITNSATANTISIGAGQNLTATGTVTIGATVTTTRLNMSGAGSFINTAATTFQVGGSTSGTAGNAAMLDMSGLGTFNATVPTFRIGDNNTGTGSGASTVILANNSTITAATLTLQTGRDSLQTLRLGSGTNIINANTIQVGQVAGRADGLINFNTATGTLTLRNQAGTGRAAVDVGWGGTGTDAAITADVNLAGHSVDLLISTLNIGQRTASGATQTGGTIANFTFDTGILDVSTLAMASKTGTTATNAVIGATLNIGGGTATIGSIATATNNYTTGTGNANATINVTGGATTVTGNITLTAGTGTQTTTATVNLDGGILRVNGSIVDGSATTGVSTFNFDGGVLRAGANNATFMQGLSAANVQAGGAIIDSNGFNITIAQPLLDAGGGLTKQGAGTLTLTSTNNAYSGATNVNGGTLALQNGDAIDDNAGPVNVALGATLQLLSNETISAFNGAGDLIGANDSTLALGANTLTTTGNAAIANVTTTTGGGIISGGSITDTDDDNNITGTNVFLQAANGIGTALDAIETAVASTQLHNTTSGDIHVVNSNASALLTVSDLRTLGFGSSNVGGATTIVNNSPFTIAANVTSAGPVVLTAGDSAAVGDNLTLNAGALVDSTGDSVTLNAGDNALINGDVTSATTTTINVDAGNLDVGTGGSLTINGVITTPAVGLGGGAFLNGQTDDDTFTFNPQTTTEFRLFGNLPTGTLTGDTLVIDVSATTDPNLTVPGSIAPYSGLGSGAWSFTSAHQPVLFGSIEVNTITGNHHLTYDNSISPVANVVVMRDSALPTARLQLRDGSTAGNIIYQGSLASILSLRLLGSAGNDTVTVDDINTLPDFGGTVPGVTDNLNLGGTAELLFDGLGGSDTLVYNINGNTASQSYAIGNGTGTAGLEGEVQSVAAGVTLDAYFQNVELTQRTGVGPAAGALAIVGDSGANVFNTTANGTATRTTITGYTPFEFSGDNYTSLAINGLGGADSIDLVSFGTAQNNDPAITLNGGSEDDTIRLHSTSGNTGLVTLDGGAGSDLMQLFDAGNTVDNIAGNVIVDGTDGNVGGNTDTLTIINFGSANADAAVVAAVNAGASQDYYVDGVTNVVSEDVIFRNIDVLNYTATMFADSIDARLVNTTPTQHDLSTVNLSGWTGADQFLLFTSDQVGGSGLNNTPTGVASGVANVNLYGDALGNPNPGDVNDTFGETPMGVIGTGATNVGLLVADSTRMIRPSVSTAIAIDGGEPSGLAAPLGDVAGDVLNVDVSALSNATPVIVSTFSPGTVVATGISPLTWTQIEDLNLVDQGRLTNVQMGDLFARTTPNADLIQITRNPTPLNPDQVRLRITATIGNYSVSNKTIMYGGGGNDTLTQSNLTIPAEFYGEAGDDYLSGAMNNDWLVGGDNNDRINGSGGDNVIWGDNAPTSADPVPQNALTGGDDQLSGLGGNDVFYGSGGNDLVSAGGGNDYVNGGAGNDTLDGHEGDDRIYGGAGNDVIAGHSGNDLLSGGDGEDRLYGNSGNDVILAGDGADQLDGGDGNDLLINGIVANESSTWTSVASTATYNAATYTNAGDNDAALLILLTQWGAASDGSSIGVITHDGDNDDLFGGTGDDDFCWEIIDVQPALTPADFNAFGMGMDQRIPPL